MSKTIRPISAPPSSDVASRVAVAAVKLQKAGCSAPLDVEVPTVHKNEMVVDDDIRQVLTADLLEKDVESKKLKDILALDEYLEPQDEIDNPLLLNFTHQIISPLNAVVGTIDNLIDGTTPVSKRPQKLLAIRGQLSRTIELVRNLAYLSQLSTRSGQEALRSRLAYVTIPKIAINAAEFFQEPAEQRSVKISINDSTTQYKVRGHNDLLQQVFMNLIENALKYCDSNGVITIDIRPQKRTGNLLIDFSNTGIGFSQEERESIFIRGKRGKEAENHNSSGSGLGLYICKRILHIAFGASITADHIKTTRKTVFQIRFPQFTIDKESTERWRDEKSEK